MPGLFKRAEKVTDLPTGLRLEFASKPRLLGDIAHVVEQEQDCRSFLHFLFTVEPGGSGNTFEITRPVGTRERLKAL